MVEIEVKLPRDLTFLSNILYEGLLFSLQYTPIEFDGISIKVPKDFIVKAIKELDNEKINNIRVAMSGNDNINKTLFEKYGINDQSRKTYYDLLSKVKDYADNFIVEKDLIKLGIELKGKNMLIDTIGKDIAVPQLLKVDRYTGISALETGYTSQQITIYSSKEVILLALLGIYSSFVTSVRHQNQQYYFFLTLSPEEVEILLNRLNDKELLKKFFRTKDDVIKILGDVLSKTTLNELILLEIYLNAEIRRLMEERDLDKVSLILFKISPEGQTYKVYELIPITIYREEQKFYEIIKNYFRRPEKFLENLSDILKPNGIIFDALKNINRYDEANNVLRAVYGLYRFIILGNTDGWYEFVREITNAYRKLEKSTKPQERKRCKGYIKIVRSFI